MKISDLASECVSKEFEFCLFILPCRNAPNAHVPLIVYSLIKLN